MKIGILFLLFIFLISNISALCEEDQVDINTASAEELDELWGIGTVKAEAIIDTRPFESIDDLIDVYGIGNVTLNNIKSQGLACVGEEEGTSEEPSEEEQVQEEEEEVNEERQEIEEYQEIDEPVSRETTPIELQTINLNPKVIKSEDDNENLGKNNYAVYGLVFFCVLLVVLFILRKNKYRKNEFR